MRVRSSHSFRFLRRGGGTNTVEVAQAAESLAAPEATMLYEWTLRDPSAEVTARLFSADGILHFWTSDAGWYRIEPASGRIEMSDYPDELRREQRLWGIPTVLCAKNRGDLVLHAAGVEVNGGAILLAAPGRFGKTTLALAFHREGYRLLTEDTAVCSLASDPLLFPGPTSIRIRPDMFDGQAPAGTTLVAARGDRIHLALDADRMGDGRPVPIRALVFLRESSDRIVLERVKKGEAIPDLWTLSFRFPDEAERRRSFSQLARLATVVPVWNVYRPLRVDRLQEIVSQLLTLSH
ncbi:MAG: hypothetical protein ACRD3C_26745 [Vicinamibacterales bacterium]